MRSIILTTLLLALCFASPAIGNDIPDYSTGGSGDQIATTGSEIPNYAEQDENVNGRPQHLDTDDRTAEELNPVERKIIMRDTVISNSQLIKNRKGQ